METKDSSSLLLFPMVKSAIQAITALIEFTEKEWRRPIEKIVITKASKRDGTNWLPTAVAPGIKATIPMVIDVLNMRNQIEYQKTTWGKYSEQINDCIVRGLQEIMETEEGESLLILVDPYNYL